MLLSSGKSSFTLEFGRLLLVLFTRSVFLPNQSLFLVIISIALAQNHLSDVS